jgi:hypothetical protein
VSTVPNAIPGRDSIEVEIFGMEGIPEEDRLAHERTKTGKFESHLFDTLASSLYTHTYMMLCYLVVPYNGAYLPTCTYVFTYVYT